MRPTKILFQVQAIAALVLVVLAWIADGADTTLLGAVLAAVAALISHFCSLFTLRPNLFFGE